MKIKYKFLLPLISLVLMASCRENLTPLISPDDTPADSTQVLQHKPTESAEYVQIDYLADVKSLKGDDARAGDLSFFLHQSNKDKEPIPLIEGDETKAYFIITNGRDKTFYQNVTLKVEPNKLGEMFLHYQGDLGLKNSDVANSKWYIIAIIGGEYDKKTKAFAYNPNQHFSSFWEGSGLAIGTAEDGINIPLTTTWGELKLKPMGESSAFTVSHKSQFHFIGHVIKVRVINENIHKFHWESTHIKETNYISHIKLIADIKDCTKSNAFPHILSNGALHQTMKFKDRKLIFENGDKSYVLPIYVCKRPNLNSLPKTLTLELRGESNDIKVAMPFIVKLGKEGQVSYAELKLPKVETELENMPLSYWNKSNCLANGELADEKGTGDKFYETESVEAGLKKIFAVRKIRIPNAQDWHTIFPFSTPNEYSSPEILNLKRTFFNSNKKGDYEDYKLEEEVHIPKKGGGYTTKVPIAVWSEYRDFKNKRMIYGIRLTDKENKYRSAWSYEYVNNGIKVRSLYLGPARQVTLDDISNNDFWEKARLDGRIIVERFFPEFPISNFVRHTYYRCEQEESSNKLHNAPHKYFVMAFSRWAEELKLVIAYKTNSYNKSSKHYVLRLIREEPLKN